MSHIYGTAEATQLLRFAQFSASSALPCVKDSVVGMAVGKCIHVKTSFVFQNTLNIYIYTYHAISFPK